MFEDALEESPHTLEDGMVAAPRMPEGGVALEGTPYILEDVIFGKVKERPRMPEGGVVLDGAPYILEDVIPVCSK